jgi:hypothetical protein
MEPNDPDRPDNSASVPPTPSTPSGPEPISAEIYAPQDLSELRGPAAKRTALIVGLSVFLLIGLAGGATAFMLLHGSSETLLNKIPASADVAGVIYLDPSAGQKVNLLRMANRFPALSSTQKLRDQIDSTLDQALSSWGLNHNDVTWVGSEAGFTVDLKGTSKPGACFLLTTNDASAAGATFQKARQSSSGRALTWSSETHGGVPVSVGTDTFGMGMSYAITDGVAVMCNDKQGVEGFIDADQGKAPALASSSDFTQTMADLPTSRLGLIYVGPVALTSLPGSLQAGAVGTGISSLSALKGIGVTVSAQSDGLAVDSNIVYDQSKLTADQRAELNATTHPNPLLASVPSDAMAVFAQENVDKTIKDALSQMPSTSGAAGLALSGITSILTGDMAVEITPGAVQKWDGALLLGTKDDATMQSTLDQIAALLPAVALKNAAGHWSMSTYKGVTIRSLKGEGKASGYVPSYAVVNGAAVIGSSVFAVRAVIDTANGAANITSTPGFTSAVGSVPNGGNLWYLDVNALAGNLGVPFPLDNIKPIQYIAIGVKSDPDRQRIGEFIRIP